MVLSLYLHLDEPMKVPLLEDPPKHPINQMNFDSHTLCSLHSVHYFEYNLSQDVQGNLSLEFGASGLEPLGHNPLEKIQYSIKASNTLPSVDRTLL